MLARDRRQKTKLTHYLRKHPLDFRFLFAYADPGMGREETSMATPVLAPGMAKLPGTQEADTQVCSLSAAKPGERASQASPLHKPWTLPPHGLAVFHGETPRLSHYFLPRLLLQGKCVLVLDGANCADPRLLERLARQRNVPFAQFNRQVQIARAFTCFQLTELIARVPQFLADFPAQVLIVTAFPELYFDEDVRDWDARVAFAQALAHLRRLASVEAIYPSRFGVDARRSAGLQPGSEDADLKVGTTGRGGLWPPAGARSAPLPKPERRSETGATSPLAVAVFSAAPSHPGLVPSPARRCFFNQVCAAANEVWKFTRGEDNRLGLICERAMAGATSAPPLHGCSGDLRSPNWKIAAPAVRTPPLQSRGALWAER